MTFWPTLRLAIADSWGGPESAEKRTWLASVIVDSFVIVEEKDEPDDIYLEEILLQIMSDEYDVLLEDGGAEPVAKDIVKLWTELKETGTSALVGEWEENAEKSKGQKVRMEKTTDETGETEGEWTDEDEGDSMDEDEAPQLVERREPKKSEEPEVDDDGFTMVKKGRGTKHG